MSVYQRRTLMELAPDPSLHCCVSNTAWKAFRLRPGSRLRLLMSLFLSQIRILIRHECSLFLYFLSLDSLAQVSNVLSLGITVGLFYWVRFTNEPCDLGDGLKGICLTSSECSLQEGRVLGPCAQGYGVCCQGKIRPWRQAIFCKKRAGIKKLRNVASFTIEFLFFCLTLFQTWWQWWTWKNLSSC